MALASAEVWAEPADAALLSSPSSGPPAHIPKRGRRGADGEDLACLTLDGPKGDRDDDEASSTATGVAESIRVRRVREAAATLQAELAKARVAALQADADAARETLALAEAELAMARSSQGSQSSRTSLRRKQAQPRS